MIRNFRLTVMLVMISYGITYAQSELEVDFSVYGGAEYNIFKSPPVLLDRTSMLPLPSDTIIFSDLFADAEYDIEFSRVGDRSFFELGSDLWYRKYIEFTDLDQGRLDGNALYQFYFTDGFSIGTEYEFLWSNRIGTSVTGDLLMRSFKYFGHTGNFFVELQPNESLEMQLLGEYEYKDYYNEQTRDPLDHANLEINYSLDYEFNRDHDIKLEFSWTDRNYFQYRSRNADGDYDALNPLRNFRYYEGKFDYNWRPIFGLRINPGLEVTRRIDIYQDYYSYMGMGGSMRIRYFKDNFYISLYGDYNRVEYDVRPAFTSLTDDPSLVYGYYDLNLKLRYSLSEQWDIYLLLESDNRASNTDLEYFKTRRPYNKHQVMIGINYSLPDIKF